VRRSVRAAFKRGGGLCFVTLGVVLATVTFAQAGAGSRGLTTGFDDSLFTAPGAATRNTWLGRAKAAGAGIIRLNVTWSSVVGPRPPVNPTSPADPDYDFSSIDRGVQSARANGLDVVLTVERAPGWAEGKHRPKSAGAGTWKPNPHAFGQFGQALARRYSGNFGGLPRVRYFQAWNEPNLAEHLTPQWDGKKPASPGIFRRLLNAFYKRVNKAQPKATVMNGGTSPYGDSPGHSRMHPLTFLRKLFCLKGNLKATKCPAKPHLDVLAHHPITDGSPHKHAINKNDVPVADFHKVRNVVRAAERTHHVVPGGHHPLWVTELWWNTKPPNRFGFSLRKQAKWIEQAFYLLWKQGATAVINLEIRDSALMDPSNSLQSGVYFHNNNKKPSAKTFRFPFVTHRTGRRNVRAWGKAPEAGKLKVQGKSKHGWRTLRSIRVKRGELFNPEIRQRGAATFRGKVGHSTSMPWHQGG
jgi:hypothetical protein